MCDITRINCAITVKLSMCSVSDARPGRRRLRPDACLPVCSVMVKVE